MQINVESNKSMNKIVKILKLYTYAIQILYNYIRIGIRIDTYGVNKSMF